MILDIECRLLFLLILLLILLCLFQFAQGNLDHQAAAHALGSVECIVIVAEVQGGCGSSTCIGYNIGHALFTTTGQPQR